MQLGSPAEPHIYLMSDRKPDSESKPNWCGDSPQLSGTNTIVAGNQHHSSEQGGKERGLKPLLFKDQLSLRHNVFNPDVSLRSCLTVKLTCSQRPRPKPGRSAYHSRLELWKMNVAGCLVERDVRQRPCWFTGFASRSRSYMISIQLFQCWICRNFGRRSPKTREPRRRL